MQYVVLDKPAHIFLFCFAGKLKSANTVTLRTSFDQAIDLQKHDITENLEAAILLRWSSVDDCPVIDEINQNVKIINGLKPALKSLRTEKGTIARQFKDIGSSEEHLASLKRKMQLVSANIKQSEASLKQAYARLDKLFAKPPAAPVLPAQYTGLRTQLDNCRVSNLKLAARTDKSKWDDYVDRHPGASFYHRFAWMDVLESVQACSASFLVAENDRQCIIGVLPVFHFSSKIFGRYAVSIPCVNYGGPLADSPEIVQALMDEAKAICLSKGSESLEVRSTQSLNDWKKKTEKVSMLLPLPASQKELDKSLGAKLRSQIRQSEKHKLAVRFGSDELIDDFYSVFSRNMRDLGTPVYGKHFFSHILEAFKESSTIVVAYYKNSPVAAAFLLAHRETLEIPWASSLRSHNKLNVNLQMYRRILGYAIERKFGWFDFGRSTADSSTYHFKKQWGAIPVEHQWHYWIQEGETDPELNTENTKYKLLIATWKLMPVWLANIIGPKVIRHLP